MSGSVNHLSEYDALFLSSNQPIIRKFKAAIRRLENPLELLEQYKKAYIFCLQKYTQLVMPVLIKAGDIESISYLARIDAISRDMMSDYIELANKHSQAEILAILLDYKNKVREQEGHPVFTLDVNKHKGDWETEENEDGTLTIIKYLGKDQDVIIPSVINGKKVRSVEGFMLYSLTVSVFYRHKDIVQSIIIEEGIQIIGERAFLECTNLKSVEIPKSIARIGKDAFSGCKHLTSVIIPPGVDVISEGIFEYCSFLSNVQIPSTVIKIGNRAFSGCHNLDSLVIFEGLKVIGGLAFKNCTSLTSLEIPSSVTEIGFGAFEGCQGLTSVVINQGVNVIGQVAFYGCNSLTTALIPASITKIDYDAFTQCNSLVIHAPKGSYAIEYAKKNKIKYRSSK